MGQGSYRAESWIFRRFVLSIYFFIAFQIPFTLGISSNLGGKTRLFCLQIFCKSTLWSATRGHLNRKWKTVSSFSPHSQSGKAVLAILWRCCFSRQWPVRTCVISCWMNLFFKHAASLWCGKKRRGIDKLLLQILLHPACRVVDFCALFLKFEIDKW